ncbi:hypothetical protein RBG61_09575 [Paludicola sp. MB14-C6]|uniref:hypothetical protein n=1 Tax=Paludihabitans sp. MB14-C6 TaxID=3070656 RepID=UPI0027DE0592|nr:hypothetical protein [Paludicola sp. MB14-C6]WMJ22237.1 hypothetical protein RBG61_09575 [Paludicola sp. MB14-C6]
MTALIIIGSIIAFFALLLSFSLTVYVSIQEEVKIAIGAFGYRYHIDLDDDGKPKKPKKKKKKKKQTAEKKQENIKKPSKKPDSKSFGETIEFALSLLRAVIKPTLKLLKHTRITKLSLYMTVCGEEADETAIFFGQVSTGIYNLLGHLDNLITLKVKSVDIVPDFVSDEAKYNIFFKVKLRFCHIIGALISMIVKFLVNTIKNNLQHEQHSTKHKKQ